MSRPEEVEAPNGVRAVEHRLDGESRVRAEASASHTVEDGDPTEVQVGAGTLWVSVPPGGVEVQVNHGGFSALVSGGAVMVDAGEGSDGLLLVTSGEALLVDAAGTSRMLTAGEAAVFGADGDLAGVDQVSEDELASDPWAVAEPRRWTSRSSSPRPRSRPPTSPSRSTSPSRPRSPRPTSRSTKSRSPSRSRSPSPMSPSPMNRSTKSRTVDEDEPTDVEDEDVEDEEDGADAGDETPGFIETSAVEVPDEQGELLDELYADAAAPAHEVSGRSVARVLEVAALDRVHRGDRAPRVPVQPGRRRRRSDGDRATVSRPIHAHDHRSARRPPKGPRRPRSFRSP